MGQNRIVIALVASAALGAVVSQADSAAGVASLAGPTQARLLLTGGRIHATGGVVEAMAVDARGVIIAVGRNADLEKYRGSATRVIDLEGQAVLPGFHDLHVHPLFGALRERECNIPQGSNVPQTQAIVKSCASKAGKGKWVSGGQWDASALGRIPDRAMLDAVAPDNPVLLNDTSGHSAIANSRALAVAGITRDTPNPAGGIIERDAAGEPTGVLRESAAEFVHHFVPPPTAEDVRAALGSALTRMLGYGITSYTEASVGFPAGSEKELNAYAALADAGILRQRVRLCLTWEPGNPQSEAVIAARNFYARERVATDCVKIFLDGVPTDSHTAAMLEPYAGTVEGRTDEASRKGMLLVKQDVLDEAVTRYDRLGLVVKFHAAGDAAVRAGLDAIAAARKANGFSGRLHDVGHCTFVAQDDLKRARAIGATFEVSPYLWSPSPINDDITAAVGPERIRRVWPVRDMIDAGALVVAGSDWAVVPSVNPWPAVEALVTREKPGGSPESFGKAEAISLAEAVDLFTLNAARHLGAGDRLGRIAPGMLADVIVLDRDPYDIPVQELHETRVMKTLINGEVVYER